MQASALPGLLSEGGALTVAGPAAPRFWDDPTTLELFWGSCTTLAICFKLLMLADWLAMLCANPAAAANCWDKWELRVVSGLVPEPKVTGEELGGAWSSGDCEASRIIWWRICSMSCSWWICCCCRAKSCSMRAGTATLCPPTALVSWENWATATLVLCRFSIMTLLLIMEKLPCSVKLPSWGSEAEMTEFPRLDPVLPRAPWLLPTPLSGLPPVICPLPSLWGAETPDISVSMASSLSSTFCSKRSVNSAWSVLLVVSFICSSGLWGEEPGEKVPEGDTGFSFTIRTNWFLVQFFWCCSRSDSSKNSAQHLLQTWAPESLQGESSGLVSVSPAEENKRGEQGD